MTREEITRQEKNVHDLCRQAVCEKDIDKLLQIFLTLHRMAELQPQRMTVAKPMERAFGPSSH